MKRDIDSYTGLEACSEKKFKAEEAGKIKMAAEACGMKFEIKKLADGSLELWIPKSRDLTDFWKEFGI